jgi:hypothetical protein
MPHREGYFAPINRFAQHATLLTLVALGVGLITALAMLIVAVTNAFQGQVDLLSILGWGAGALAFVASGAWLLVILGMVRASVASEHSTRLTAARLERLESLLSDQTATLRDVGDIVSLSDKAKSLLFREKELEAIRDTVNHELIQQNYTSAESLINELSHTACYADEVASLHAMVSRSKDATIEEKIDAAIDRVEGYINALDWPRSLRETQRLVSLFPDNERVGHLAGKIHVARNTRKRDLLKAYGEATRKNDVDLSIELLKDLDSYLTPQEAAALQESARGVFKARLNNLGVQFSINVADEQWDQAISAGTQIMAEFPNSRMAQEVRQKMGTLKAKIAPAE